CRCRSRKTRCCRRCTRRRTTSSTSPTASPAAPRPSSSPAAEASTSPNFCCRDRRKRPATHEIIAIFPCPSPLVRTSFMPLFEFEAGRLVPAQFGHVVSEPLDDEVLAAVRDQVL